MFKHSFDKASLVARIFADNSLDGVYTHRVNRFARFVQMVVDKHVLPDKEPLQVLRVLNYEMEIPVQDLLPQYFVSTKYVTAMEKFVMEKRALPVAGGYNVLGQIATDHKKF